MEVKDGRERQLSGGENHRRNYAIATFFIPHSHSIILSYGNALNFQRKFFPYPMKNRLADPSEICALDFKHEFGRSAICSVSATIGIDRSILADSARTTGWTGSRKKTVSPSSDDQLDEISPSAI